jgi:hypothetical protein
MRSAPTSGHLKVAKTPKGGVSDMLVATVEEAVADVQNP